MIILADSSPLITLARAQYFDLLHEFYGAVIVSREVHNEVTVAGAGLPGAEEMRRASWIRIESSPAAASSELMRHAPLSGLASAASSILPQR